MRPPVDPNVLMGFYFSPRGGSAQVARYLCRALGETRWSPTLFTGSIGSVADDTNAARFFSGIPCRSLDYSAARSVWTRGRDPMVEPVPMHASFEDKAGVADRIFFDLDAAAFDLQVASWTRFIASRAGARPDIVHLHHLTPIHEAIRNLWPGVPIVTHLHGTELKMLASARDGTFTDGPNRWMSEWVERMRRWAAESDRSIVVSAQDQRLAEQLLPVDPARITIIGNGVDTAVFKPRGYDAAQRLALWKRWLVDDPRGWQPGRPEGSIRYGADDLRAFVDRDDEPVPVVLFAGRFLQFKRVQLLIEAHHAMRSTTPRRSVLVIVGGFPGEWEGEHPFDTVQRLGAKDVFFVGWRDHRDLAKLLACSDVFAAPAVNEPFGLVYLEAMAAGLPPIATDTGGPASFINVDAHCPTGWLVPPDDVAATALAMREAVSDRTLRAERGRRAAGFAREHYSWAAAARAVAQVYDDVTDLPAIGVDELTASLASVTSLSGVA